MAKSWAKSFYNSKAWKDTRASYIKDVHGLCERCEDLVPGYIVHHKIILTPENIKDSCVSLNKKNLEFLCKLCHDKEHGIAVKGDIIRKGFMFTSDGQIAPCD